MLFGSILIGNYLDDWRRNGLDLVNRALASPTTMVSTSMMTTSVSSSVPTVMASTVPTKMPTAVSTVMASAVASMMLFSYAQISRDIGDLSWLYHLNGSS
jgi:flagellar biosynthesis protein FlhB